MPAPDGPAAVASADQGAQRWSLGVIGAGQVVTNAHLPVLTTSFGMTLAWIFDIDSSKAISVARAQQARACRFEDLRSCLSDVNIVLLAAPYGARSRYYELLADFPFVALFVEKPLAKTIEQHRAICRPYADYQIACDLNRRAADTVRTAKDLIEHRVFGALREVRAAFGHRGALLGGGQYNSNLELAGGGVLFEMGIHYLDTVLFCSSAKDITLESGHMIEDLGFDLHTEARLRITLADGLEVPLDLTVSVLSDQQEGIDFVFDHASLSLSLSRAYLALRSRDHRYHADLSRAFAIQFVTSFQHIFSMWRDFLDGLTSRRAGFASAYSSLLTTKSLELLYSLPRRS